MIELWNMRPISTSLYKKYAKLRLLCEGWVPELSNWHPLTPKVHITTTYLLMLQELKRQWILYERLPQMLRVMKHWQNNQWKYLKSSKIYDYHGGWSSGYHCYRKWAAQDGLDGRLSSSFSFFSFWFIKTWCTSN